MTPLDRANRALRLSAGIATNAQTDLIAKSVLEAALDVDEIAAVLDRTKWANYRNGEIVNPTAHEYAEAIRDHVLGEITDLQEGR